MAAEGRAADALPLPKGKVVVRREKKGRAGKTVTRVTGLGASAADVQQWASRLKRQLGCGATVEGSELVLLGDLVERVVASLESAGVERVVRGN